MGFGAQSVCVWVYGSPERQTLEAMTDKGRAMRLRAQNGMEKYSNLDNVSLLLPFRPLA